jgi:spore coat protein U-like protein
LRIEPGPVARLAFVILVVASGAASGGTGTVTAQSSVNTFCTVATTALSFGAYDPIVANTVTDLNNGTTGSVTITCVKGTSATIALGNGANYSASTRHMKHATVATELLPYQLYLPPSNTPNATCTFPGATPWIGATVLTPAAAPDKNSRAFNVCGTVPAGQDVQVGTYSDTVVVTVTF